MKSKKIILAAISAAAASALSGQSFVAGWDFDGVSSLDSSALANWGDQDGSALLTWTHDLGGGPPLFTPAEFGISNGFNSAVVGNEFAFIDPNTGFDEFSDGQGPLSEGGFEARSSTDTLTFSFDASTYTDLSLTYALDATGDGTWESVAVDLSGLNGDAAAQYVITTVDGARYDNFAFTGAVIPEPSSYAALFGALALSFVAARRRK